MFPESHYFLEIQNSTITSAILPSRQFPCETTHFC